MILALRGGSQRQPLRAVKNSYLLQTIGDQLFWAANTFVNLGPVEALDVFAGSGLFMSHAYLHHCERADLWDIDPFNAEHVRHWGKHVQGYCGDSIKAVNTGDARIARYNFVLLDNPLGGPFGPERYCEHFDLFPAVFRYLKPGPSVLVMNYIPDARKLMSDPRFGNTTVDAQEERRRAFYETDEQLIRPELAVAKYTKLAAKENVRVRNFNLIPRSPWFHFLMLFLEKA
jgi:hypothetical protein